MATLYIREYAGIGTGTNASGIGSSFLEVQAAVEPAVTDQTVSIGGASVQSSAFNAKTGLVRIHTDSICSIAFGANPTATATSARLAANQTEYFSVFPGHKVAVITNT